jgi:hypothetical protein
VGPVCTESHCICMVILYTPGQVGVVICRQPVRYGGEVADYLATEMLRCSGVARITLPVLHYPCLLQYGMTPLLQGEECAIYRSDAHPFNAECLPLKYSGDPGVNGVYLRQ